jgi:nucleotide-binding universal stress UspA family protein
MGPFLSAARGVVLTEIKDEVRWLAMLHASRTRRHSERRESMSYATLMVHLEIEHSNDARLRIAGDLANRFDAKLIGIAACETTPPTYADTFVPGELIAADRAYARKCLAEVEARFREAVTSRVPKFEWRQADALPTEFVASEARAADLLITGTKRSAEFVDPFRVVDTSDLVRQAGRPVLVVPPEATGLSASRVLVGWKDTRESRRAVVDAMPFLKQAEQVLVAELSEDDDKPGAERRVNDVVHWLARHGVTAVGHVGSAEGNAAERLSELAAVERADLIVTGAYGHSRWREWVMGGVTRDLIMRADRCALLAH